jgi:2-polyprenyl-3-methyl-5-hydroxy-6-metoxy-1,4-benzoquinol methylase
MMNETIARTTGPEFQDQLDSFAALGPLELGPSASSVWRTDPRRFPIVLSRYKFVSKMLVGRASALEVGCGDGFFTRIVGQTVPFIHGVDYDPSFISWAAKHAQREGLNERFSVCDMTAGPLEDTYEGAYSLDVIEHVSVNAEDRFIGNIAQSMVGDGTCIVGTPNITAEAHASKWSKAGHINLKSAETLRDLMERHFRTVFIFSMNDEVVHTGFSPMAHYLLAVAVGVRRPE